MEQRYTSILLASVLCTTFNGPGHAQCTVLSSAVAGPVMLASTGLGGTENRSGIAYDPVAALYYSVDAGSETYPVDTYDAAFDLIDSIVQGYDYRGAWWNAGTSQFEGNGFSGTGVFVQTLDGTGHPMGAGAVVVACGQPDAQSCGAYDDDANEIIHYFSGSVHRYDRGTGTFLASAPITGLPVPVTSLNSSSIGYTGCPGHEYAIYDYVDLRVLFINKATMAYAGFCQLPLTAPARSFLGMTYAHDIFWLFDLGAWHGYAVVLHSTAGIDTDGSSHAFSIAPNPASQELFISMDPAFDDGVLEVTDAMGRAVLSLPMTGPSGSAHVNIEGLPDGAYHARLRSGQGVLVKSLVIAR